MFARAVIDGDFDNPQSRIIKQNRQITVQTIKRK